MKRTKYDTPVSTYITVEQKEAFQAFCANQGITSAGVLRHFIIQLITNPNNE